MNVALIANSGALAPLKVLFCWWTQRRRLIGHRSPAPVQLAPAVAPELAASFAGCMPASSIKGSCIRPLRVVREFEAGQRFPGVGRMTISGRMADVCAELDRLAAREAELS